LADPLQEGLQAFDPHAVSPHSVIILEICTLSASESTALGGRTERSQSPSWCMASLTTETLLALPLRARIASNSLIESCSCVTRRRSASRSASSRSRERRGKTFTRPEVKARAPDCHADGA